MPRKGASSHRTKLSKRNTKHKPNDEKKRLKKKQQFADDQEQNQFYAKRKPKIFEITYEIRKRIKDVKMKKEIDFEHLESEILEMEKNVVANKELIFAFAQPTNWDDFSDEDDSEFQEDENDSRSQVSQREHLINKTQKVWVNEKFENDLDNSQSVKKEKSNSANQAQKIYINIKEIINLKGFKKKFEDAQLLEEVQDFVENT